MRNLGGRGELGNPVSSREVSPGSPAEHLCKGEQGSKPSGDQVRQGSKKGAQGMSKTNQVALGTTFGGGTKR